MDRRHFLALSVPALAVLLEACSSSSKGSGTSGKSGIARSDIARAATTPNDALDVSPSINILGLKLYRKLAAAQPSGNLLLSPTSIGIALLMAEAGSAGETRRQFVATMDIANTNTVQHSANGLLSELARRNDAKVELTITDALFAQQGFSFEDTYLQTLAAEYGAGVQLVDYQKDPEAARKTVNAWVAEATKQRIKELLAQGTVSKDSRLTLVNAIHMKAPWLVPFSTEATKDAAFTAADGTSKQVKMMDFTQQMQYFAGDGFQCIELPYDSDNLTSLVFLPEEGTLARYEQEFTPADAIYYFAPTRVHLQLPRFDFTSSFELSKTLQEVGLTDAFTAQADFSGMTKQDKLHIDAVVHQANITVDESGTEAAAATAVGMAAGAAPGQQEEIVEMNCNRPFIFAIRDRNSDALLFLARVGDPTAS